jgi:7-carboxy-7-deazaguanine synthase (Cx14CxxC type)
MTYAVKEIYYTLQGEGANTGRPAVFCRFSGCNLWTGREEDRDEAVCQFCDTDFVGTDGPGGGRFETPADLAEAVRGKWPEKPGSSEEATPLVVCTGGEPLLQVDDPLVDAFHEAGFEAAVETNGTCRPPEGVDWICMSPKAGADLELTAGDELKLVYPQDGLSPEDVLGFDFDHFFLQPKDGPNRERHTQMAAEYCLEHPEWRLSLQTHKYIGLE